MATAHVLAARLYDDRDRMTDAQYLEACELLSALHSEAAGGRLSPARRAWWRRALASIRMEHQPCRTVDLTVFEVSVVIAAASAVASAAAYVAACAASS